LRTGTRFVEIAAVSRHYRQAIVNRSGSDNQVRLGVRVSRFAAFGDQNPPPEHDIFCDWQNALIEHGPHRMRKPGVQLVAPAALLAQEFDAEAELGQSYRLI